MNTSPTRIKLRLVPLLALVALAFPARAALFQIADAGEFARIVSTNSVLTTNATLNVWLEGPVWVPAAGGYLVFSDMGNNKLKKLVPPSTLTDFLSPPANTLMNGNTLDGHERLISCEAGTGGLRMVMVTNNVIVPLASTCNGLKFYSPNDVAVKSDGTIWFTDPGYNGNTATPPQPGFQTGYYVYRFDPADPNATCTAVITSGLIRPNGLCFSPDETRLYVADSDNARHRIQVYSVSPDNTLSGGSVFATIDNGVPDGIRCDVDGRVWSSAGDGAQIFAPDGHLIGKILCGRIANLCFGGANYQTLYMTGQPVVTSIPVLVPGTPALKKLEHAVEAGQLNLYWPSPSTGFALQSTGTLEIPSSWSNLDVIPAVIDGRNWVSIEPTNAAGFFRLRLN